MKGNRFFFWILVNQREFAKISNNDMQFQTRRKFFDSLVVA